MHIQEYDFRYDIISLDIKFNEYDIVRYYILYML